MKARTYNALIAVVGVTIVGVLAWSYVSVGAPCPAPPCSDVVAPLPASTAPTAQVSDEPRPLALTIRVDGLSLANSTASPLDDCFVEILGGFVGRVPIIPAQGSADVSFVTLFDSTDAAFQAHLVGKTFEEFVRANTATKATVACHDINGHRVATIFHGGPA